MDVGNDVENRRNDGFWCFVRDHMAAPFNDHVPATRREPRQSGL